MSEGKAVRVAWPPAGVKDINDLVKGRTTPRASLRATRT